MSRIGYLAAVVVRRERAGLRRVDLPCIWAQGPLREMRLVCSSLRGAL